MQWLRLCQIYQWGTSCLCWEWITSTSAAKSLYLEALAKKPSRCHWEEWSLWRVLQSYHTSHEVMCGKLQVRRSWKLSQGPNQQYKKAILDRRANLFCPVSLAVVHPPAQFEANIRGPLLDLHWPHLGWLSSTYSISVGDHPVPQVDAIWGVRSGWGGLEPPREDNIRFPVLTTITSWSAVETAVARIASQVQEEGNQEEGVPAIANSMLE